MAAALVSGGPLLAQSIPNPSFEADTFTVAPGTVNSNSPITGWTASPDSRVGLNPAGGQNFFANNGAVPNGSNVVFLQSASGGPSAVLGTTLSGLTPGQAYKINFRANAKTGSLPSVRVAVDSQWLLNMSVSEVGSANPYRYGAVDFTASAASQGLYFTNDTAADTTLLLDNLSIAPSSSAWSFAGWSDDATSGVDSSRRYTHAINFGGGAAPSTTINGVAFTGVINANPGLNDSFRVMGMGSSFGSDDGNAITSAGGGSAALMKRFIYGGNPGSIALFGLTPGVEYLVTFYTCGWENGLRSQTFANDQDRLTVNQDHFGDNAGVRISCRYVAPASGIQVISWSPMNAGNGLHLYGFSNCELTPSAGPVVVRAPRAHVSTPGSTELFAVTAGGAIPLSYQWFKDGAPLAGQTSRLLTLANVTAADLGAYSVEVSNSFSTVMSAPAALTFGTIANPSFEEDFFLNYPGYVNGNTIISGWTASDAARAGLNPTADGQSVFANNGAFPEGGQAAFLQSASGVPKTLSTIMNGLTPGQVYTLNFRANARGGQTPVEHLTIDGASLLDFLVGAATGTNAYRQIAVDFIPSTSSPLLVLTNDSAGDNTVALDNFQVAPSSQRWSYTNFVDDATSGVDPARNYTHAYNFGSGSGTIINGVEFKGAGGANPAGTGFSTSGFGSIYNGDANAITASAGGAGVMMRDFIYGGVPQTLILTGLVPFVEYVATIYSAGWGDAGGRFYGRAQTFSLGNDRLTVNQDHYGNDVGIRVSCRYVADATGVARIAFEATHNTGGTPSTLHTYGFSNYELSSTNAPIVYRQPQSGLWPSAGSNLVLSILVGGQDPISYQWSRDGVDIAGQTSRTLVLSNVSAADAGNYSVRVSNVHGALVSSNAAVEVGLPVVNASFEADTFTVSPGYITNNFVITGWSNSAPQSGINPLADLSSPFANTGGIPDGRKAAFLQGDGTMSQVVTGFTPGRWYHVKFYENSRAGYGVPTLAVTAGGLTIVPVHEVPAGPYAMVVSDRFQAVSESMELVFVKGVSASGADSTLLLDYVGVLETTAAAPVFVSVPVAQRARVGESVVLSGRATGSAPISYQWQFEGADMPGEVSSTLVLNNLSLARSGQYRLIAQNSLATETSPAAALLVGLPIPELYNTGVDNAGGLIAADAADPHYTMAASADPAYPGPAVVVLKDSWPVVPGTYMTNGPVSKWISLRSDLASGSTAGNIDGLYTFRTHFMLDSVDPATAEIRGKWAMDNLGMNILINGTPLGITNSGGFAAFGQFTITSGFVDGSNTLDFVISNLPPVGPMAMRVELYGVAQPRAAALPQILSQPASVLGQQLQDVTFSVVAAGSPDLSYQWYYEGIDLMGETQRTLHLTRISQVDQQGTYYVIVSNPEGFVESDHVTLTINQPPEAGADFIACGVDRPVSVPVAKLIRNDAEYEGDTFSITGVTPLSNMGGTVQLSAGWVAYTPPAGYSGQDQFNYILTDSRGGQALGVVTVTVGAASFLSVFSAPVLLPSGRFQTGYSGVAGYPYTVERSTNVTGPWEFFGEIVADANGLFQLDDPNTPAAPMRFYRVVYP